MNSSQRLPILRNSVSFHLRNRLESVKKFDINKILSPSIRVYLGNIPNGFVHTSINIFFKENVDKGCLPKRQV